MSDAASLLLARQALDDFKQQHDARVSELLESNNAFLHRAREADEKLHEAVSLLRLSHNLLPGGTTRDKVGAWLDRNSGGRA